jgi:hypothetical protein
MCVEPLEIFLVGRSLTNCLYKLTLTRVSFVERGDSCQTQNSEIKSVEFQR